MRLKALLFDVDGTLADTEEAHRCAFNDAFQELGLDWNWSKPKYAHLLATTGGKERLRAYIDSLPTDAAAKTSLRERVAEIHKVKTALYMRSIQQGRVPLRVGVERLLDDAARHDIRLAIATTTTFANIEALLCVHLGPDALKRFSVIGAGDQVPRKKPAADIYDWVVRQLQVSSSDCVAIEDSLNGMRAAKAAGIYTIVTPSYWTQTEDFSEADLVLPGLVPKLDIATINEYLSVATTLTAH